MNVIEVQIGYQRVRQVHAHLLGGLTLLHNVYLKSYQRVRQVHAHLLMHLVDRGPNLVSACSPGPCASFGWIDAAPPCLSEELC